MRIALTDLGMARRDQRMHILFLNDLFVGSQNMLMTPLVESLKDDYYCMDRYIPKGPRDCVRKIEILCMSENLRPDLIVAHGTAATLAAQISGIEKVLIRPSFSASNIISNLLQDKQYKARIKLPNLGHPEYLTISRQMAIEYHQLEKLAYQRGIHNAHSVFFDSDVDSPIYNDHIKHFGNAIVLPAENEVSAEAVNAVATFIKGVLSVDRKEHIVLNAVTDAEEAHHLWRVREPTNKRAQKKLVCFAKREGGKLVN